MRGGRYSTLSLLLTVLVPRSWKRNGQSRFLARIGMPLSVEIDRILSMVKYKNWIGIEKRQAGEG